MTTNVTPVPSSRPLQQKKPSETEPSCGLPTEEVPDEPQLTVAHCGGGDPILAD